MSERAPDDEVATCAKCGAPLLQRTDPDGRVWLKCTGEHTRGWLRVPFMDAEENSPEWRSKRLQELIRFRARWSHEGRGATRFNAYMQEDSFVTLADAQAALVAIGALEEDERVGDGTAMEEFDVAHIAGKLGWEIERTRTALDSLAERELIVAVDVPVEENADV